MAKVRLNHHGRGYSGEKLVTSGQLEVAMEGGTKGERGKGKKREEERTEEKREGREGEKSEVERRVKSTLQMDASSNLLPPTTPRTG